MKVSVKQQNKKATSKVSAPKKAVSVVSKKSAATVPLEKRRVISSYTVPVTQQKKSTTLSKVKHSAKRRSKLMLKSMLLSKSFHVVFKVAMISLTISIASYGLYSHFNSNLENDVVVSKSEIVDRVSKLTTLPLGAPDAVVRVQDPETLKKQNDFYSNVKEGDYIVMYPKIAVIYDLRNNSIISEKRTDK